MSELRKYLGSQGEDEASEFLKKKGYGLVAANFQYNGGEIDLIMEDKNVLVFIEVKRRRSARFGLPEESITPQKIKHMVKAAMYYLATHKIQDKNIRFDVIAIDQNGLRHHVNAFDAGDHYFY